MKLEILAADAVPASDLAGFIQHAWGGEMVAAHGERIMPAQLPGLVAVSESRIVGHASYRIVDGGCEITSIAADPPHQGIGSALMEAITGEARRSGCRRAWLTTTNDNLDALRFYQRRGFRLIALRPGAVDVARRDLKPELPAIGTHGIPMRDELDLELTL